MSLASIEPKTHQRSYAVTVSLDFVFFCFRQNTYLTALKAYYEPSSTRTNLFILSTAYAHRLVTIGEGDGNIVATGVEFNHGDERKVHVAHARREVIIAAGYGKNGLSPMFFERSLSVPP